VFEEYDECIYVLLDEKKLFGEKSLLLDIELPFFDNLEKKLEPLYSQLNNHKGHGVVNVQKSFQLVEKIKHHEYKE